MGFPTPVRQWLLDREQLALFAILRQKDGLISAVHRPPRLKTYSTVISVGLEDATDRIWRLLNLPIVGQYLLYGQRIGAGPALAGSEQSSVKILWVKTIFIHPTTVGGQIRTLEMVKRLHRLTQLHYLAFDEPANPEGLRRAGEYSVKSNTRIPQGAV